MKTADKLRMIKLVAEAIENGQPLERRNALGVFIMFPEPVNPFEVIHYIDMGVEVRVKPARRMTCVRLFWKRTAPGNKLVIESAQGEYINHIHMSPMFHSWAGDEFDIEVPEL